MHFDYQEIDLFLFKTKQTNKKGRRKEQEKLLGRGGAALVSTLRANLARCTGTSVWVVAFGPGRTLGSTGGVFIEFHFLGLPPAILTYLF